MNRNLEHYPANSRRIWYLALSVAATFVLYYEAYVLPSVAPLVLKNYNMSFSLYIFSGVAAASLGAVASLLGSLADRIGRANMVVYGVLLTSLLTIAITFATTLWLFFLLTWSVGFVEGIILVATPALVRDFSPQLRRATAMAIHYRRRRWPDYRGVLFLRPARSLAVFARSNHGHDARKDAPRSACQRH